MSKTVYFEGPCAWAQLQKTDKFGNYSIQLYLDPDNLALYTKQGLAAEVKEDERGKFVRFKRVPVRVKNGKPIEFGAPRVFNRDGQPITELIGNGSKVICKVTIYDTPKGRSSTLEAVQVSELIPYGGPVESAVSGDDFKPF